MAFQQGQSGNPAGRPKGSRDRRTQLRELLQPHAEALIEKAVNMALAGDTTALRMCLDRICPPLKPTSEPVVLDMPANTNMSEQTAAIFQAVTDGLITTEEGAALIGMLSNATRIEESERKTKQFDELKKLIGAL